MDAYDTDRASARIMKLAEEKKTGQAAESRL